MRQKAMLLLRYKSIDSQMMQDTIPNNRLENFTNDTGQTYRAIVVSKVARTCRFINRLQLSNTQVRDRLE